MILRVTHVGWTVFILCLISAITYESLSDSFVPLRPLLLCSGQAPPPPVSPSILRDTKDPPKFQRVKKKKKKQIVPCPAAQCSILMPSASCVPPNSSPGNSPLCGTYSPITSAISQALLAGLCESVCISVHLYVQQLRSPLMSF